MRWHALVAPALGAVAAAMVGCSSGESPFGPDGWQSALGAGTIRRIGLEACAFGQPFTLESENDWFPLTVGSRWEYRGIDDGAELRVVIEVLDEVEVVGGVTTRVVRESEWEDDEQVEVSRNFFAETANGTACYFGEEVDIYENGQVVSHGGAWRADAAGNAPGVFMPGEPEAGDTFLTEGAPGVAADEFTILARNNAVSTPAGRFRDVIHVREVNLLDGDIGFKTFAEDVGMVIDGPAKLVSYHVVDDDD